MSIITDPDFLDRFQVIFDPVYKSISIRGSGTNRYFSSTGSGTAQGDFRDNIANSGASVTAGDILAVVNDPANNKGVIGHYKIAQVVGVSGYILDRSITQTASNNISYRIFSQGPKDTLAPSVADGVNMQALYSFTKEEWRNNSLTDGVNTSGEDLIKFTFPFVSITSEQFEVGGVNNDNWDFADDTGDGQLANESTRNLIRTGGWASINRSGEIIENYPSIVTLGSLDSDAQVYYQLTSATTTPIDFVLPGVVNQSIRTLETIGGVTATGDKKPVNGVNGSVQFIAATNEINPGVDLFALGFTSGELIQVRQSSNNNNGLFRIASSGAGATSVRVTGGTLTNTTETVLLSPLEDNRDYLVLRVRKKGKSYAQSEIADIGVSQVNTIVNRFPLAHVDDPAISLSDGQLAGDDTVATLAIKSVEQYNTASDGVTGAALVSGNLFTFTSAGAAFNLGILQPGDSIVIPTSGFFEIASIDSATSLAVFNEPTGIYQGGGTSLAYTTYTSVIDSGRTGSVAGTFAWTAGTNTATLTDATRAFTTDGGLGQRAVTSGDILEVYASAGDQNAIGYYQIYSAAPTVLTVLGKDLLGGASISSTVSYRVKDNGMYLQYKESISTPVAAASFDFGASAGGANKINRDAGDWLADDYYVGGLITVAGATNTANNGTYIITAATSTVLDVVRVDGSAVTFVDTSNDVTANFTGTYGFIRVLNNVSYSFNWRLFGNNGTLSECFQFLQRELRRTTDIDGASTTSRGDITDLLMTYIAPNATALNLFIDSVNNAELNNLTSRDSTGNNRNFPFLVTLRITSNANITNAASKKIVVFFSDSDGVANNNDEFGTPGATIVQDSSSSPMTRSDAGVTSTIDFTYDYTAGGGVDRDITVVCITTDTGQYVSTTSSLVEENIVTVSLVAGLERNYDNS
jgi:hypothetical protein